MMAYYRYSIVHFDKSNNNTQTDISTAVNIDNEEGIEATSDNFNLTINLRTLPRIVAIGRILDLDVEDQIKIYLASNNTQIPSASSNNLIMDGKIDTLTYNIAETRTIQVKGVNKLEALLNAITPVSELKLSSTVSAVSSTSITASSLTWDTDADTGDIQKTLKMTSGTANGSLFRITALSGSNNRVFTLDTDPQAAGVATNDTFEVYANSYTIIRKFIKNVNDNNTLNTDWETFTWDTTNNPTQKSDGTPFNPFEYVQPYKPYFQMIEEISTDEYTKDGSYIFYMDTINNKFTWKLRSITLSSTLLKEGDNALSIKAMKGTFDIVNASIIHGGDDLNGNPIYSLAYNSTSIGKMGFKWKYIAYTELAKEIADKNQGISNSDLRSQVFNRARDWGNALLKKLGAPRWNVEIEVRGSLSYTKGDLHELEIPSMGWNSVNRKQLRLNDISHSFNSREGWITKLIFREDENTAIENFKQINPA